MKSPEKGTKISTINTPQAQIKINLPLKLKEFLESKAAKYGVSMSFYVRHLILKDIENTEYPGSKTHRRKRKTLNEN